MELIGIDEWNRRLRVLDDCPPGSVMVHEIYESIQGESTYAGLPCVFVRLSGCPLRCRWCDTPHAFTEGAPRTLDEIVSRVEAFATPLVELTGGEPLAQPLAYDLLARLADAGRTVLLETSGALPIEQVDPRVTIIMDLKCPGSDEVDANRLENLSHLKPTDEIKFVLSSREDFDWACRMVAEHDLTRHRLLASCVFGELDYRDLCVWILASGLPFRFQPQLHKLVWGHAVRGV